MSDYIDEDEARALCQPPSDHTWERWHRDGVVPHYVPPGTRQRRYKREEIIGWIESGRRGGTAA